MNLLEHLEELRIRLVVVGLSFLIIFMVFIAISPLAAQLLSKSTGIDFVTLHPAEAVIAYVRLALFLAVLAVMPIALYHLYLFIAPALRRAELRAALITLPFSVVMFYAGVLFGYAVIVRLGLPFLAMLSTRA
ncbi:hypothetical protein COT48_05950, partial [Candidatus Woesearchaeota archaeon CG08_land_8_20_14_0_20_47_9]